MQNHNTINKTALKQVADSHRKYLNATWAYNRLYRSGIDPGRELASAHENAYSELASALKNAGIECGSEWFNADESTAPHRGH